ncbi:MAG TPA: Fur family transcriptional regulator [Smithella sp.]|nr:Fur family transcriptional regulator [Smithella sp.]
MERHMTDILKRGLKVTPQRLAILKLLREKMNHPTAENIHSELLKEYPAVSLTTVYNTLSKFVETGIIRVLDADPQKKRFDHNTEPHNHFQCRVCNNVFDVLREAEPDFIEGSRKNRIEGHRVEDVSVNLKGVCRFCMRESV